MSTEFTPHDQGIEFPQITICKEWGWDGSVFPEFPALASCANGDHGFFNAVENCLNNDPNFDLDQFITNVKNIERFMNF